MASDLTRYETEVETYFGNLPDEAFELVSCLFCQPSDPKAENVFLFNKGSMRVHRCRCGLVWNHRQAKDEVLEKFYSSSLAMTSWSEIKETEKEAERQKVKFLPVARYLAGRQLRSVLDIGCGNGVFLASLRDLLPANSTLIGADLSAEARNAAAKRGILVKPWGLKEALSQPDTYDAITLWGVLEHAKYPLSLLRDAHARLNPGGYLVVCVPNVDSLVVTAIWEKCFTFCPQHLWYFNYETLTRALIESGLRPVFLNTIEPETVPTMKAMNGLPPYEPAPSWAFEHLREGFDERDVLANGNGYKIIAVAQSEIKA
jgi:2-polyprenyl-3-methyl-5-hydroxy-6-metoxy-1,4-benzoquinol methylase